MINWLLLFLCVASALLISFPSSVFVPRPSRCQPNVYFFFQPFAHTNRFLHSCVPSIYYFFLEFTHVRTDETYCAQCIIY